MPPDVMQYELHNDGFLLEANLYFSKEKWGDFCRLKE